MFVVITTTTIVDQVFMTMMEKTVAVVAVAALEVAPTDFSSIPTLVATVESPVPFARAHPAIAQ